MSSFILKNIDVDDIWENKTYYAFRLVMGSSYNLSLISNSVQIYKVIAKNTESSRWYKFLEVTKDRPGGGRNLFNSGSIIPTYRTSWKNQYGWWVCETYEDAALTRENLLKSAIHSLELKTKKLAGALAILQGKDLYKNEREFGNGI